MKASNAMASLSVVIPTHGRPTLLKRMLQSLAACDLPASYRELVVVENGSKGGVEAPVEKLSIVSMCSFSVHK